jgi:predicted TIM-barrel enzyme
MRSLPKKFLGAMIAVQPLPGSPLYCDDDAQIAAQALSDLHMYSEAGVDAIILENSHDLPYIKPPLPARVVELMKQIAREVRNRFDGPIGIQMLEAANETLWKSLAKPTSISFAPKVTSSHISVAQASLKVALANFCADERSSAANKSKFLAT